MSVSVVSSSIITQSGSSESCWALCDALCLHFTKAHAEKCPLFLIFRITVNIEVLNVVLLLCSSEDLLYC